ncbi:hypothetical protein DFJ73DRAFT_768382 [Zopfochytrium polystomum]|nr:hypothetical protein DFJ73DRAFT_768382 [Zopfochytrium polystomum]
MSVAYALECVIWPTATVLDLEIKFDHAKFTRHQAAALLHEFDFTISKLVECVRLRLRSEEMWRLSESPELNVPRSTKPPSYSLIHNAFEFQALLNPEAVAVEHEGKSVTYKELDLAANILCRRLQSIGVKAGDRVGLLASRSLEMIVGMLAALKSGAAYVPVDAATPGARAEYIFATAAVSMVLFSPSASLLVPKLTLPAFCAVMEISVLKPESNNVPSSKPPESATGSSTAFVVFTSGSTGNPKGVLVTHAGVARLFDEPLKVSHLGLGVRMSQFLAIGFDGAQSEIFIALGTGTTLVLRSTGEPMKTIASVDVLHITPTGLGQLNPEAFPNLKQIFVGAEHLPAALAEKWSRHLRLINLYGPTETSCFVAGTVVEPQEVVTVGRPLAHSSLFVVDSEMRLVPKGVVGELAIGGLCVSGGYIGLPDENAKRFVPNPFGEGRLYRSGDLVRWLDNGHLQIVGRIDNQVKFKGYRIELDEVAGAIGKFESVQASTVVIEGNALIAFVCPPSDWDELRRHLVELLPHYMVPSRFVGVDAFPVNSNGKLDKSKLIDHLAALDLADFSEPVTSTERTLAAVWAQYNPGVCCVPINWY